MNQLLSADWYPLFVENSDTIDFARTICFWFVVAIALAFIVTFFATKGETRQKFLKISIPTIVVLFIAIGIFFLVASFVEDGINAILFYPLFVLVLSLASLLLALFFKAKKPVVLTNLAITVLTFLAVLICMSIYFLSGESEDYNGVAISKIENVMLFVFSIAIIFIIAIICLVFGKDEGKGFNAKSISYAAICIAMSFALSYIRIVKLPQGGSVTVCSLLPLMIYSYIFGVRKGVFAGLIYGVLQAIQDPWIVHPMQFLLDYPIAFSSIGIAGLFGKFEKIDRIPQLSFSLGSILASVLRFASHLFSGVFAFSEYAYSESNEQISVWIYSLSYNSFVFVDIAICIVVGIILFSSKNFVNQIKRVKQSSLLQKTAQ